MGRMAAVKEACRHRLVCCRCRGEGVPAEDASAVTAVRRQATAYALTLWQQFLNTDTVGAV